MTAYTPTTGQSCSCKRGIQRDNCPQCEGSGMVIDFAAIHRRRKETEAARSDTTDRFLMTPEPGGMWTVVDLERGQRVVIEHESYQVACNVLWSLGNSRSGTDEAAEVAEAYLSKNP